MKVLVYVDPDGIHVTPYNRLTEDIRIYPIDNVPARLKKIAQEFEVLKVYYS